ncbi:MAG: thioesterase [Bacteroidetes bacterium 4572_77]|nr:MAG: thioesterase [Bacteroidetes bacterium 4572_77]
MLQNLPMGFLAGLKVKQADKEKCVVHIPYKYLNKNPFKSMYFASQSMAAELSTGLLAMAAVKDAPAPISMLVLNMEASFKKKAIGICSFSCVNGKDIQKAVEKAIETEEGQTIKVRSIGQDSTGDTIAEFHFTWTFKTKKRKPK